MANLHPTAWVAPGAYLFTGKPSLCNVALIRPGFAGPPSPQGKALGGVA